MLRKRIVDVCCLLEVSGGEGFRMLGGRGDICCGGLIIEIKLVVCEFS